MTTDVDPWWWRAACRGSAPLFDAPSAHSPAEAERIHRATLICGRCTVRAECLADAQIGRDEGIRAGRVLPPVKWKQCKRKKAAA